jgi:hypothetical protein
MQHIFSPINDDAGFNAKLIQKICSSAISKKVIKKSAQMMQINIIYLYKILWFPLLTLSSSRLLLRIVDRKEQELTPQHLIIFFLRDCCFFIIIVCVFLTAKLSPTKVI